jgi:hypothetical protein
MRKTEVIMNDARLPEVWPLEPEAAHELVDKFVIAVMPALIMKADIGVSKADLARQAYRIAWMMMQAKADFQDEVLGEPTL